MANTFNPTPGDWIVRSVGPHAIQISTKDNARGYHSLVAVIHETSIKADEPDHKESDAALVMGAKGMLEALEKLAYGHWNGTDHMSGFAMDAIAKATTVTKETADDFHARRFNQTR